MRDPQTAAFIRCCIRAVPRRQKASTPRALAREHHMTVTPKNCVGELQYIYPILKIGPLVYRLCKTEVNHTLKNKKAKLTQR